MSLLEWQTQLSQYLLLPEPLSLAKKGNEKAASEKELLSGLSKLALYQELLLNTCMEALEGMFPFTVQCVKCLTGWPTLAETYRRNYPNPSYKLMEMAEKFSDFLSQQDDLLEACPYLSDLAYYEWLDMLVLNLPDKPLKPSLSIIPPTTDWSMYQPVWNPARRLVHFDFNIPQILDMLEPQQLPFVKPEPVSILIYRDPETLQSRFFCLNRLTAILMAVFEIPESDHFTYADSLELLYEHIPTLKDLPGTMLEQQAAGLFQNCLNAKILLGSIPYLDDLNYFSESE